MFPKPFPIRIACLDPRPHYSPYLAHFLNKKYDDLTLSVYVPFSAKKGSNKKDRGIVFLGTAYDSPTEQGLLEDDVILSETYSTFLYPFQVFYKARKDGKNIVHIQWELKMLGSYFASFELILLLFFLKLSKIRAIVTVHTVIPKSFFERSSKSLFTRKGLNFPIKVALGILYKLVYFLSDAIIVHSEVVKNRLFTEYHLGRDRVFVIPYGSPSSLIIKLTEEKTQSIINDKNNKIILVWGAMSPRKGLHILIQAFEKLASKYPSWVLVIAGGITSYYYDYYLELKKLSLKLAKQQRIIFLGRLQMSEVHSLIDACEIMVFPYIYNFGASSTMTFAIAHRKVIVATDLDFIREILENNENAILVKPGDLNDLVTGITIAMEDKDLRTNIVKGIDMVANQTDWSAIADQTMKIYRRVIYSP